MLGENIRRNITNHISKSKGIVDFAYRLETLTENQEEMRPKQYDE